MKDLRTFLPDRVAEAARTTADSMQEGETWRTNSEAQAFLASMHTDSSPSLVVDRGGAQEGVSGVVTDTTAEDHLGESGLLTGSPKPVQDVLGGSSPSGDRGVLVTSTEELCVDENACRVLISAALSNLQDKVDGAIVEAEGQVHDMARVICGEWAARQAIGAALGAGVKIALAALGGAHPAARFMSAIAGNHLKGALTSWGKGNRDDVDAMADALFTGIRDGMSDTVYSLKVESASGRAPADQWAKELHALATDPALPALLTQQVFAFMAAGAGSAASLAGGEYEGTATGIYHFRARADLAWGKLHLLTIAPPRGLPAEQFLTLRKATGLFETQGWQISLFDGTIQFEVSPSGRVHLATFIPSSAPLFFEALGEEMPPEGSEERVLALCGVLWDNYLGVFNGAPLAAANAEVLGA